MSTRSLQPYVVEHEQWKFDILHDVAVYLDAVSANVNSGVSVPDARMRGLLHISLQLAKLAINIGKLDGARSAYSNCLTARQEEIMLLLDLGVKPREIAYHFTLSEATVRTHIRNARRLLNITHPMRRKQS